MDALTCNHCGARLEVAATTKFVTCARCDTVLEIKRTGTARYTEGYGPAAQPAAVTDQAPTAPRQSKAARKFMGAADVALEEELNALDRQWEAERERYLLTSEFGGKRIPSKQRGLFAGVVLVGLAVVLFFLFRSLQPTRATEVGPYVSGLILLFGFGLGWFQYSKGVDYERAYAAYQTRRNTVIANHRR